MKVGFFTLLTLVFIALKLIHVIAWPWMVVLLPLWAPAAIFIVMLMIGLGFAATLAKYAA